jgi:dCMP deaminase
MNKPTWDEYFLGMARMVATRATCPRRSVGCVIVDPETKNVISTGYNGAPRGTMHCGNACENIPSGSSFEKCRAVHAELNAITAAALNGATTRGAEMYLTTTPCVFCSRVIINAGISKVYALTYYPQAEAVELLTEGGIDVVVVNSDKIPSIFIRRDNENS